MTDSIQLQNLADRGEIEEIRNNVGCRDEMSPRKLSSHLLLYTVDEFCFSNYSMKRTWNCTCFSSRDTLRVIAGNTV